LSGLPVIAQPLEFSEPLPVTAVSADDRPSGPAFMPDAVDVDCTDDSLPACVLKSNVTSAPENVQPDVPLLSCAVALSCAWLASTGALPSLFEAAASVAPRDASKLGAPPSSDDCEPPPSSVLDDSKSSGLEPAPATAHADTAQPMARTRSDHDDERSTVMLALDSRPSARHTRR
jgi:hypothetical protein